MSLGRMLFCAAYVDSGRPLSSGAATRIVAWRPGAGALHAVMAPAAVNSISAYLVSMRSMAGHVTSYSRAGLRTMTPDGAMVTAGAQYSIQITYSARIAIGPQRSSGPMPVNASDTRNTTAITPHTTTSTLPKRERRVFESVDALII